MNEDFYKTDYYYPKNSEDEPVDYDDSEDFGDEYGENEQKVPDWWLLSPEAYEWYDEENFGDGGEEPIDG